MIVLQGFHVKPFFLDRFQAVDRGAGAGKGGHNRNHMHDRGGADFGLIYLGLFASGSINQ